MENSLTKCVENEFIMDSYKLSTSKYDRNNSTILNLLYNWF